MEKHTHNGIDSRKLSQSEIAGDLYTGENAVKTKGDETVNGTKTFGSIPVLPTSIAPTSDNHTASKEYADDMEIPDFEIVASDDLRDSADTLETTQNEAPFKKKEIEYNEKAGTVRVYFECQSLNGDEYANAELYKNGVATGNKIHTKDYSSEWETLTVDISVANGDLLQLYLDRDDDGYSDTARCRNFRLSYKAEITPDSGTINMN